MARLPNVKPLSDEQREVVVAHLDLVDFTSRQYRKLQIADDLYQAGCFGLMLAAQKRDKTVLNFESYSTSRIRSAIRTWLRTDRLIRVDHRQPKGEFMRRQRDAATAETTAVQGDMIVEVPDERPYDSDEIEALRKAIDRLGPSLKTVVVRRMAGETLPAIAKATGAHPTTVHERYSKALAALKGMLERAEADRRKGA